MVDVEKRQSVADQFVEFSQLFRLGVMKPIEKRFRFEAPPAGFLSMVYIYMNGSCTMSELTHILCCSKQQTTQTVDKLIQSGFVSRKSHDSDRRKVWIVLTDEGRSVVEGAMKTFSQVFVEMLELLSDEEFNELSNAIDVMNKTFRKISNISEMSVQQG